MKLFLLFVFCNILLFAENKDSVEFNDDLKLSVLSFISHTSDINDGKFENDKFKIRRAYLDLRKSITSYMDFRLTYDTYEDDDGNEQRIKYLYALFHIPDYGVLDNTRVKTGIIHNPWLEYQSDYYKYRMQGHLFLEKVGIFDSADFGVTLYGDVKESKTGPKIMDYAVGVYNGTGYKGFPVNPDRALQGKIGIMPLWRVLPEWKFGAYYLHGRSNLENIEIKPKWETKSFYSVYEHQYFTISGEYVFGTGNQFGSLLNEEQEAIDFDGYSLFLEMKPTNKISVIGRFDSFHTVEDIPDICHQRVIAGIAYFINNNNIVLLDYEHELDETDLADPAHILKATIQISFRDIISF
jgi:hypothetical protein